MIGENGLATLEAYLNDLAYLKQKVTPTPLSLYYIIYILLFVCTTFTLLVYDVINATMCSYLIEEHYVLHLTDCA